MLKIAECSDSFLPIVDGVGRVVYNYADYIGKTDNECYVICPLTDAGYRGKYPFEIVDYLSISLSKAYHYRAGVTNLDSHYHLRVNQIPFDIIHVHNPGIVGQEAIRLAKKHDVPLVGTFHSKYYEDFFRVTKSESIATLGARFVAEFYEQCDAVWTVSYDAAETLESYGYTGKISVVPNGTDLRVIEDKDIERARREYKIGDEPTLLYVGQMDWKKNIRRILEAAVLLKNDGIKFRLVFAGQGQDAAAIKQTAQQSGIADNCVFCGHVRDMSLLCGIYGASDLFVFPSLYDTAGLVVREAAVMLTPSVVVRGSAPAECISDGVNGLVCEDDCESLYRVIKRGISDRARLREMGQNARVTIPIPWSTVMDSVIGRYEKLAALPKDQLKKKHLLSLPAAREE